MKTRNTHGLLQLGREALAYCQCASALILGNKALFVSVDLIGEKNQVILELIIAGIVQTVISAKSNVVTFMRGRTRYDGENEGREEGEEVTIGGRGVTKWEGGKTRTFCAYRATRRKEEGDKCERGR